MIIPTEIVTHITISVNIIIIFASRSVSVCIFTVTEHNTIPTIFPRTVSESQTEINYFLSFSYVNRPVNIRYCKHLHKLQNKNFPFETLILNLELLVSRWLNRALLHLTKLISVQEVQLTHCKKTAAVVKKKNSNTT